MYVADTHALIHYTCGKVRGLGRAARRLFAKADLGRTLIYIPTVVLWEAARLTARRRVELPQQFDRWCRAIESSRGFAIAALEWLDVDEARKLPFSDPYDCLISGTAIRLSMPLITRDDEIVRSGLVETVW